MLRSISSVYNSGLFKDLFASISDEFLGHL